MDFNLQSDAPILIVMGQSNAHGHGTKLPENERITQPLTHVYGLTRKDNQAYGLSDVTWSGFTTEGMNLGEVQDHTACLAESFARLWQTDCDKGIPLPPLYIIQISVGGQGIYKDERDGENMWYPGREKIINVVPGSVVDVSLYPLAVEILSLAMKNLKAAGKTPRIIGVHWNQWESEVYTGGECLLSAEKNYTELFAGFREALGTDYPLWLYEPLSLVYENDEGLKFIAELFNKFERESELVHLMRSSEYPGFDPSRNDQGIFMSDCVHYSPEVQKWFGQKQYEYIFK